MLIIAPQAIQDLLDELEASRAWVFLTKNRERSICVKTQGVGRFDSRRWWIVLPLIPFTTPPHSTRYRLKGDSSAFFLNRIDPLALDEIIGAKLSIKLSVLKFPFSEMTP